MLFGFADIRRFKEEHVFQRTAAGRVVNAAAVHLNFHAVGRDQRAFCRARRHAKREPIVHDLVRPVVQIRLDHGRFFADLRLFRSRRFLDDFDREVAIRNHRIIIPTDRHRKMMHTERQYDTVIDVFFRL